MAEGSDNVVVATEDGEVSVAAGSAALSVFDPSTGRIVDVNRAWLELYGYDQETARTMRVTEVSAEPDATRDAISRASGVGGARIEVRWHKKRDGTVFPVHLTAGILRVGTRTLMFALMHDITLQLRSAEALARSEAGYRALVESVPDAVIVHREGRIVYVNAAAKRLFGVENGPDLVGSIALERVHPDDRGTVIARVNTMREAGGSAPPLEERLLRIDGETVPAEIAAIPTTFDGEPAVLAIAHDLTARKRLEAQLLTSDRLASLGRLAASVGHEINNPLAYVLGNAELLRRAVDQELLRSDLKNQLLERIASIEEGALRVRDIVRDLRTLSRQEDEARVSVDVNRVVALCADMAGHELRHRARLVRDLDPSLRAWAHEGRLGQVLLNLLVNAGQAIADGAVADNEVRVVTRLVDGMVQIEVRDTGAGIPPHLVHRVFEPFFTTKAPGAGTGLGLSICHHIVTSLGGTIAVEPNQPRGTCFRVRLPSAPEDAPVGSRPAAPTSPTPPRTARRRLLLVEDEPQLASALSDQLLAWEVRVAGGRREGISALAEDRDFDAVLCDVLLGDGTAVDVHEWLIAHAPELVSRVVFMTGGAASPEVSSKIHASGRPVLDKPFTSSELEERLASLSPYKDRNRS